MICIWLTSMIHHVWIDQHRSSSHGRNYDSTLLGGGYPFITWEEHRFFKATNAREHIWIYFDSAKSMKFYDLKESQLVYWTITLMYLAPTCMRKNVRRKQPRKGGCTNTTVTSGWCISDVSNTCIFLTSSFEQYHSQTSSLFAIDIDFELSEVELLIRSNNHMPMVEEVIWMCWLFGAVAKPSRSMVKLKTG